MTTSKRGCPQCGGREWTFYDVDDVAVQRGRLGTVDETCCLIDGSEPGRRDCSTWLWIDLCANCGATVSL